MLLDDTRTMRLSEHLTLWEAIRSESHPELVKVPSPEIVQHLADYAGSVFEPIRELTGGDPIHLNSMYRNPVLNYQVGGEHLSVHQVMLDVNMDGKLEFLGVAADYRLHVLPLVFITHAISVPAVKCVIWYPDRGFCHVDTGVKRAEKVIYLSQKKGVYVPKTLKELEAYT